MSEFGFKEITPGLKKGYYTNKKISETSEKVLFEGGISIEGENITPLDLFSTPEGLEVYEKQQLISKNLKIDEADLEKKLPDISRYWQNAKDFYKTFLIPCCNSKTIFPREIEKTDGFNNLRELEKALDKTVLLKKDSRIGLAPFYCALFSLMVAEREYEIKEFEGLLNESKYLAEQIFNLSRDGIIHFHSVQQEDEDWSRIGIMTGEDSWMEAKFSFRGKTKNSSICKLASKPEFSAEEIIKDGIGLKFEVADKEKVGKLLPFLCQFLRDNFSADKIIFENTNIFEGEENELLKDELRECKVAFMPNENPSSHKNFKVAKIRGEIKVPQNGEKGKLIVSRNFEAQVVLTNNKNETGLVQNKIYKRIQKLSLFSRLFGSFGEDYLDLICQEASEATSISKTKIKKHIVDNYLLKLISKSKNIKYVSREQFQRWKKAGIVPSEIKVNTNKHADRTAS